MDTKKVLSDDIPLKPDKLRFILVLLFVFTLPFDRFYTSLILILLIVTSFLDLSITKIKNIPKQIWIFQLVFFLGCLGYIYSYNKGEAGFILERQLAILAFPLILPLAITFNSHKKELVFKTLTISCILSILYLFINILYIIKIGHLPIRYMFSKEFFNHAFSAPIGIHAGYLSLYVSLSTLYLVKLITTNIILIKKTIILLCIGILCAGQFFLASRNAIFSTIFIICFIYPFFYVKRKLLFFGVIIVLLIVFFTAMSKINYLNDRFSSDLITDINTSRDSDYSYEGAEPRIERWKGAWELVTKSPLIGYGTGDEILMLKTKYVEKELFISYLESFNAHNQYLSYLLKNGIIGLLIFLGAFIYYLKLAIRKKDFMYISFLTLLLIGFFTENILDANKGIYFFAFFNTFLGYSIIKSETKNTSPGKFSDLTKE